MIRLRKFCTLNNVERWALLSSLLLLPAAAALLRWSGFAAAQGFLAGIPVFRHAALAPEAAARMVNAAAALLGASCLPRSLVLWRLLRSRGAVLRFGVARSEECGFAAHAWVELDDRPLNDSAKAIAAYGVLTPPATFAAR